MSVWVLAMASIYEGVFNLFPNLIFDAVLGVVGTALSLYIRITLAQPNSNFLEYNHHLYNGAPFNAVHVCWRTHQLTLSLSYDNFKMHMCHKLLYLSDKK